VAIEQRKKRSKKKKGLRTEQLFRVAYGHIALIGVIATNTHPGRDSRRHHQHQRPTAADTRQPVGRCVMWARCFFIDVVAIPSNLLALVRNDTGLFEILVFPLPPSNELIAEYYHQTQKNTE
jgi:hypothetical protein